MQTLLVQIDDELKERLKIEVFTRKTSLKALVVLALEQYLGESPHADEIPKGHPHSCGKCTFTWNSLKADPAVCPSCKSYSWRLPAKQKKSSVDDKGSSARYKALQSIFKSSMQPIEIFAKMVGTTPDKLRPYLTGDSPVTEIQLAHIRKTYEEVNRES